MIKYNGRDDRLDAFLGSVIEPAAAEYAESMIAAAQNPQYSIPPELDKRCLERINGSSTAVRRSLRTILIAAVIAALLGTSAFAVYNEVRQSLAMKREDVDEGSRITFVGMDTQTVASDAPALGTLTLSYIPDGFECIVDTPDCIRYKDKYDNFIVVKKIKVNSSSTLLRDKENAGATSVACCGYEGYKDVKNRADGREQIDFLWLDTDKQMVYEVITVGISENELEKILEGASCFNGDD